MKWRPANRVRAISAPHAGRSGAAFTLLEIMVVVAIMGVILAAGIPSLYKFVHKEGFRKSVSDIMDVCSAARAQAIISGKTTEVVFYPKEGKCELAGGGGKAGAGGWVHSAQIEDTTTIEMLDVNLHEYKDADVAQVRFFPNGTSDELTLILRSDKNEWRKISLEITTGLASVNTNPNQWQ